LKKKAGRPKNDWPTTRMQVPKELVPEFRKQIEQWKLEKKNESNGD
jgi:hypothetical protein